MTDWPEHIAGVTFHKRLGAVENAFSYGIDYVLIDPDAEVGPALFGRNRWNLASVHDRHHGGVRGDGAGAAWAKNALEQRGLEFGPDTRLLLLTQPAFLGYIFNPVSFWIVLKDGVLIAVIAEVNNTFGDRHSYACHHPDFARIGAKEQLKAHKVFHVSPFQNVSGEYAFTFDWSEDQLKFRILHTNAGEGVVATLTGKRKKLTNLSLLSALIRRPAGALRTIALIYWQAMKLKMKGAPYKNRPTPPSEELS